MSSHHQDAAPAAEIDVTALVNPDDSPAVDLFAAAAGNSENNPPGGVDDGDTAVPADTAETGEEKTPDIASGGAGEEKTPDLASGGAGEEKTPDIASGGVGDYADDNGYLLEGLERLGSLGTDYWSGGPPLSAFFPFPPPEKAQRATQQRRPPFRRHPFRRHPFRRLPTTRA